MINFPTIIGEILRTKYHQLFQFLSPTAVSITIPTFRECFIKFWWKDWTRIVFKPPAPHSVNSEKFVKNISRFRKDKFGFMTATEWQRQFTAGFK